MDKVTTTYGPRTVTVCNGCIYFSPTKSLKYLVTFDNYVCNASDCRDLGEHPVASRYIETPDWCPAMKENNLSVNHKNERKA